MPYLAGAPVEFQLAVAAARFTKYTRRDPFMQFSDLSGP